MPDSLAGEPLRILIVKLSSLGDVVQTMPVVQDILQHHPNAQIDWVVEESFAPLLQSLNGLRKVIPIAQRRWRKQGLKQWLDPATRAEKNAFRSLLRSEQYHAVIDAQGLLKSAFVARKARLAATAHKSLDNSPLHATFGNRSEACGYEWPVRWLCSNPIAMPKRIHAVQRTRLLCAKALNYDIRVLDARPSYAWNPSLATNLPISVSTSEGVVLQNLSKVILLVHGSSRADNSWALENWQVLAKQLSAQSYTLVLPHSNQAELTAAKQIAQNHPNLHVLNRMDLLAISQLIQHCHAVIGLDTGLSHIAVALNKPCLQIFLHDRAWRAGPMLEANQFKPYQNHAGHSQATTVKQVWQAWLGVRAAIDQTA